MIPALGAKVQIGSSTHSESLPLTSNSSRPPRVWLVDDNHELRSLLALLLTSEGGFDCSREFPSATAVLDALTQETPPEVILLDIQMGSECGLDAIRPIKSLASFTHVLMLTTCSDSIRREQAFRNGATDFLLKSYPVKSIVQHIRLALETPVPIVEPLSEDLSEENRMAQFAGNQRNADRSRHGARECGPNRLLRGVSYIRSRLTMLF